MPDKAGIISNEGKLVMKVLIADDSAITRGILEKTFRQNGCEIAGAVSNGRKAVDFCREHDVDVVVSDYDMPEMGGIEAAKVITEETGIPVVLYADDIGVKMEAMKAGALLFEKKPSLSENHAEKMKEFAQKVISAVKKTPSRTKRFGSTCNLTSFERSSHSFKILCIGASTGGPSAVQEVLSGLGDDFPLPVLYTQHLDVGADEKMAAWFNQVCPNIPVSLAKDGEIAEKGHVYLAPADTHLVIDYVKDSLPVMKLSDEPPERFLRPAVNKLFRSAAKHYKSNCLAVLMTGMGRDGAEGCKEIVDAGGYTIAEDKSTCTVFGMPAAAIELNAATKTFPRDQIAKAVLQLVK